MTFTKKELLAAFLDGMQCMKNGGTYSTEEAEKWFKTLYGDREKRIADAEWSRRMDDANRAAGVDI